MEEALDLSFDRVLMTTMMMRDEGLGICEDGTERPVSVTRGNLLTC